MRFVLKAVLTAMLVLGLAVAAPAAAKDEYAKGVSAFNSLLGNEKRAGLRAEWQAVAKHFERALSADPKGGYAPKSMFFLGRSYEELARRSFVKDDRASALEAYDRLLKAFPKHDWADDAMFRKGLIWLELAKDPAQADGLFKGVVAVYPKGDMAPKAREMLARTGSAPDSPEQRQAAAPAAPAPSAAAPAPAQQAASRPAKAESRLLGIRHWSSNDYTRVVMDMNGDVKYERALVEKASNGNRQLQITLQRTDVASDVMPSRTVGDGILSQILVSPDREGGALVSFDLMQMDHYRVFTLPDPYRVVIDIYGAAGSGGNGGQSAKSAQAQSASPKQEAEADHVQAALAELETKREVKKKDSPAPPVPEPAKAKKPAKSQTQPAGQASSAAAEEQSPPALAEEQAPEITVSSKQKKYAGNLVEQLGLKVRTIMIDAGHGGKDPGAVANGQEEKDINLRMARILGGELQQQGFEVHYTRTRDTFIPLEERTAMANAKNADLFISLHCNALKDNSIKGLEVYYLNLATDAQAVRVAARENGVSAKKISDMQFILSDLMLNSKINESRQMASLVEQETLRSVRPRYSLMSHGSKGAFFYVLTGARMPAILVELGYLTNPGEAALLGSDAYLTSMARGLTAGVVAYKKKLERFALNGPGKS